MKAKKMMDWGLVLQFGVPAAIAVCGWLLKNAIFKRIEDSETAIHELTNPKTGIRAELVEMKLEMARSVMTAAEVEHEIQRALQPITDRLTRQDRVLDEVRGMLMTLVSQSPKAWKPQE